MSEELETGFSLVTPTIYQGVELRSKFEASAAYLLDRLHLAWDYEPYRFIFGELTYVPDFWVPRVRLWIECRGYRSEKGQTQIETFGKLFRDRRVSRTGLILNSPEPGVKDGERVYNRTADFLVLGKGETVFFDSNPGFRGRYDGDVWVCLCDRCKRFYICVGKGYRGCRKCGAYEGTRHIAERWFLTIPRGYSDILLDGVVVEKALDKSQVPLFTQQE